MRIHPTTLVAAVALGASTAVWAQSRIGRTFTATGTSCDQVTWSEESLGIYPRIASACREVMERDGNYYVRFEGVVQRVEDQGRVMTIDFRDGDRLRLTPPENLSLYINGRLTTPRNLRPGDQLNFYIPQDQLIATFFAGQPDTAPAQTVPISPVTEERVAAATPPTAGVLPRTASALPMLGAFGWILVALGATLTYRRVTRVSA